MPAIQVQTLPLEGPRSLGQDKSSRFNGFPFRHIQADSPWVTLTDSVPKSTPVAIVVAHAGCVVGTCSFIFRERATRVEGMEWRSWWWKHEKGCMLDSTSAYKKWHCANTYMFDILHLVGGFPSENINPIGLFLQVRVKTSNIWNHHLVVYTFKCSFLRVQESFDSISYYNL